METIKWTDEMTLGVPAMDDSHKGLLDAVARIALAPDDQFGAEFIALIAAFERDFREEEALMENINFAGLRSHREQHARVLSSLHHVDPRVTQGDIAAGREAVSLLPQWFSVHVATMDRALAAASDVALATAGQEAGMFTHILLPTDGSPASEKAIRAGIAFARQVGAKVTGLYVVPNLRMPTHGAQMLAATAQQFTADAELNAKRFLGLIEQTAQAAGVPCQTMQMTSDHPYEAIVEAAREQHCDLITMASHGRKGMKGFLLGSETQKVLMHSQIPVLVYR